MKTRKWLYWTAIFLPVLWVSSAMGQGRWWEAGERGRGHGPGLMGRQGPGTEVPLGERTERFFDALDADGDGRINRDEFVDRVPKAMRRLQQMREELQRGRQGRGLRGPMGGRVERPDVPGHGLPQIVDEAVRKALREQHERMLRGPQAGHRPRAYGFQGPGVDRGGRGSGPHRRGADFDRPRWGRDRNRQFDRPGWPGCDSRVSGWGRGRPDKGKVWGSQRPPRRGPGRQDFDPQRGSRGGGKGMPFGMLDTNRDGKIQKAEIQRVRDILTQALTEVGDEELTREQLVKIMRKLRVDDSSRPRAGRSRGNWPEGRPRGDRGSKGEAPVKP
ncbi:MAG: hypothetical protein JSV03_10925 [Planctomycetota bacterium]|nr:MAG: hypothetical protein JSV03_10925 [Planctomycetota bacterium]